MVQCDMCDKWEHYKCAGVDSFIKNHAWFCEMCNDKTRNLQDTGYTYENNSVREINDEEKEKDDSVENSMMPCTGCNRMVKLCDAFNDPISKRILCSRCYSQFYPVLSQLLSSSSERICQRCGESIKDNTHVICTACKLNFHQLCVGVFNEAGGGDLSFWKCEVCISGRKRDQLSVPLTRLDSKVKHGSIGITASGTTISSNRRRLEMKRVEEERLLAIVRLQEFQKNDVNAKKKRLFYLNKLIKYTSILNMIYQAHGLPFSVNLAKKVPLKCLMNMINVYISGYNSNV